MSRIIITGATGSIGMALLNKCIREKKEVLVICRKESARRRQLPVSEYVEVVECDLSELESLNMPESEYEIFYHLGWAGTFGDERNDTGTQLKNIQYTLDAVKLAHRVRCHRFIGVGSQAELGRVDSIIKPETPERPENAYGIAKLCAGQLSRLLCKQLGMEHIWVRVLSVYGPYDGAGTMISILIRGLLERKRVALTWGEQIWDYLYSDDAAEALYLLGIKGKSGKTYILGNGKGKKLKEYMEIIKEKIDADAELGYGEVPYGSRQVMKLEADITELTRDTGFIPQVSFKRGIDNTISWMKNGGQEL